MENLKKEIQELKLLKEEEQKNYQRIVHDLKNPLANIQVNINLMRIMGKLNESQNECYEIIEKDLTDMTKMVLSILDLAHFESLKKLSIVEELNLGQLIQVRAN